jgi:O-antigen/teichoic acid export membrane protein
MNQGLIKFAAEFKAKGETSRTVALIKRSILLKAFVGILLFVLNYTLASQFAALLQRPDLVFYIQIASISIIFQVVVSTALSVFVGLDKSEYNAITNNVQALSKTIVSIALVLTGFGVAGAILGHVASYVVAALATALLLYLVIRSRSQKIAASTGREDFNALIRYGAPLFFSVVLIGIIPLYQNFMLAFYATDAEIGNYKAAQNFIQLIAILSVPITTALLPGFAKIDASNTKDVKSFFRLSNKYTSLLIIPFTILIIIHSADMVQTVYGTTFQTAATYLATYCLLYLLVGIGYLTLSSFFNGLGETRTTLIIASITFILLCFLSPFLGGLFGVLGIIISLIIASGAATLYGLNEAKRKHNIPLSPRSTTKIYLVALFSAVPSLLLLYFTDLPTTINLLIGAPLYVIIYLTLTPLAGILTKPELQTASQIVRRTRPLRLLATPVIKFEMKILQLTKHQSPQTANSTAD